MTEQDIQVSDEFVVQTPLVDVKNDVKKVKRDPRSYENKLGRQKYHEVLTKKVYVQNERILDELRWVRHKLDRIGEVKYSDVDVEGFAVQDEVDREILQRVREVGVPGILPKIVAADVNLRGAFNLKYYEVSRRILRMNKRLHFETGKYLFEKRGHKWALTKFAFDAYVDTGEEVEDNSERELKEDE